MVWSGTQGLVLCCVPFLHVEHRRHYEDILGSDCSSSSSGLYLRRSSSSA